MWRAAPVHTVPRDQGQLYCKEMKDVLFDQERCQGNTLIIQLTVAARQQRLSDTQQKSSHAPVAASVDACCLPTCNKARLLHIQIQN